MARISFDTFQETANSNQGNYDVKLFSLKDDGDEAIVRIMHDSVEDFDIITTHPVKIGENYRKVSCIRDPREPMDKCPLCQAGYKIQQRFFIHMIHYEKDATGQITATPVVWERTAREYATKLKTMIEEYGPLSDSVFKIRRNGKKGDMDTTYEILYANPSIYRPDLYPKDTTVFEGYTALGKIVFDKSFEEINEFLATGNFPQRQQNVAPTASAPVQQPVPTAPPVAPVQAPATPSEYQQPYSATPVTGGYVSNTASAPVPANYVPSTSALPTGNGAAPAARPARYY